MQIIIALVVAGLGFLLLRRNASAADATDKPAPKRRPGARPGEQGDPAARPPAAASPPAAAVGSGVAPRPATRPNPPIYDTAGGYTHGGWAAHSWGLQDDDRYEEAETRARIQGEAATAPAQPAEYEPPFIGETDWGELVDDPYASAPAQAPGETDLTSGAASFGGAVAEPEQTDLELSVTQGASSF